ncbi:LysM peptidoglycan-binding domain-containing protein [Amaricoccus solimangrovi]|uniref:LysM peptidoglycan-binding domain-containing protein n=1 Tax=Amaricoccus solimangrovi TaxID=2589815 RepID=A0A501X0C1_9RHOB|nr:LysM peptidoglycan-binding domain-containing protein [Amaricoccus solimangrovi]TPE53757.1 LysM peptidoglycan-binding domain-containing protein [Amaricoccus solimangrovi]
MDTTTPEPRRPGRGRAALAIGACLAVAVVLVQLLTRGREEPAVTPPAATPPAATREVATGKVAAPADRPAETAGETPSVEVMRVSASGSGVVAGRARPGANVAVLAGDRPLAEVKADEAGRFVAMFEAGASAEPRALTVETRGADGTTHRSQEVLVILPGHEPAPPAGSETPAGAAAPGAEPAAEPAAAPVAATALITPGTAEVTPVARPANLAEGQVAFASISYGEAGAVALQGFGDPGAALRAYVDGALAVEGRVGPDGRWTLTVPEAAPGTYTIRVDQLDATGRVVSRTETPFRRDTGGGAPPRPGEVSIVVQPGNNLWTLARIHYGTGMRYTQIFEANPELIADPDLIYPGQVFRVPESAR